MVTDIKVERMITKLGLKNLKHVSSYNKVSCFLKGLAPSTAEDYSWRIARHVRSQPSFPEKLQKKYEALNVAYKKKYVRK